MKRIVFLIIASLLVLGLVLPGCGGEENFIKIAVVGPLTEIQGANQWNGATMAAEEINAAGGVDIGGTTYTIELVPVETRETTDGQDGSIGAENLTNVIDDVDFIMGGFQTTAVQNYREVAMDAHKVFFNCGAAEEMLQHSVVNNYTRYKYWFKSTPYNEYFLVSSVLRNLNAVAIQLRQALGLEAGAYLDACIIAANSTWARDEQVPIIQAGLPALNVTLKETYVGDIDNALSDIVTKGYNPHIIIPIYSGDMGVYYATALANYTAHDTLAPMSVGINVMAQLKAPWAAKLSNPPGENQPACAYEVILDTWAEGVEQTSKTAAFLTTFMDYMFTTEGLAEYPLYTAATYDACYTLKACLEDEDVGYVGEGVAKAKAADIIAWYEDPTNAIETTTGWNCLYQRPGLEVVVGAPGLTEAQVREIYDIGDYGYTYNMTDWLMPPHTTHDLVYGPGGLGGHVRATGLGAQWQWDAEAGRWKKVGVWPMDFGDEYDEALTDQYGCWNFAYNGTVALVIPQNVIAHHTPE